MRRGAWRVSHWFALALALAAAVLLVIRPAQVPRLWFDEGWNLAVARNLAERGLYAQLMLGQPAPASMVSVGPPVMAPLAASFRALGVGMWQARLPGILFTALALAVLYELAHSLCSSRAAVIALFAALFMTGAHIHLHPIVLGRQAIGEVPALVYLLAGYLALLAGWRRRPWLIAISAVAWSLGVDSKPQALPFFVFSLAAPLAWAVTRRDWRWSGMLAAALAATLVGYAALDILPWLFLPEPLRFESRFITTLLGLLGQRTNTNWELAFVPAWSIHIEALRSAQTVLLPAIIGLAYTVWKTLREAPHMPSERVVARLALLALTSSWLAWWALISVGWLRYLFPALFISSLFTAACLDDLLRGFPLRQIGRSLTDLIQDRGRWRSGLALLVMLALVLWAVLTTAQTLKDAYIRDADASLAEATAYLNTQTAATAMIETYESELFFLLARAYHYPSSAIQMQLNRRVYLNEQAAVAYDPLQADPDMLVVGPMGKLWKLYDDAIASGAFHLVRQIGVYDIYERIRTPLPLATR